jgi:hypothetical protein
MYFQFDRKMMSLGAKFRVEEQWENGAGEFLRRGKLGGGQSGKPVAKGHRWNGLGES